MGRTKTASAKAPEGTDLREYLIEPSAPLCWHELFGNDRPVEVEIGCGKGLFLSSAASEHPERNYLGIEIARKFARFAAIRIAKLSLVNARIARADARQVLGECLPDSSIEALHIYFPDPWWKRRHRKRRIFTEELVAQAARVLARGGGLYFSSDVAEYFETMVQLVQSHTSFTPIGVREDRQAASMAEPLTNFERKYCRDGRTLYRASYRKAHGPT